MIALAFWSHPTCCCLGEHWPAMNTQAQTVSMKRFQRRLIAGHLGGGAQDSRVMSSVESMTRCTGAERLPRRFSRSWTAIRPSSVPLQRTAVIDGVASAARSLSAPAITDTSPGIERPLARIALRTPASMAIPPAMMAVGRLGPDKSEEASRNPNSAENAPVRTMLWLATLPSPAEASLY